MFAREGQLELGTGKVKNSKGEIEQEKQLILKLRDGRYEQRDDNHPDELSRLRNGIVVAEGSVSISLKALYEKKQKAGGVSSMALGELLATEKSEKTIEINKRLSNALATLAFALLAVPLAITAQRKETSVGFAISLAIGLVYYLFFFLTDMARNRPHLHPELLVWVPNIVFFSIGAMRFAKLSRR
jgi:lipopolysaccharide export system permease protein